jgi:hypothetical protein
LTFYQILILTHWVKLVWSLDVIVVGKNVQSTFTIQTDLAWEDFYDRARAKFDDPNTKLAYKLTGDAARPPPFQLNDRTEYNKAMDRVVELCTRARTKKIEMSLFNHVSTKHTLVVVLNRCSFCTMTL